MSEMLSGGIGRSISSSSSLSDCSSARRTRSALARSRKSCAARKRTRGLASAPQSAWVPARTRRPDAFSRSSNSAGMAFDLVRAAALKDNPRMPYASPPRLHRPARTRGPAGAREGAGLARAGDDRDPDPAAGRAGGPAVLFENVVRADGTRYDDAGAGQPVRHGRARRLGHGPRAATSCARSARRWPSCASPSRRAAGARRSTCCRWCKTVHGDEAEDGRQRAVPGGRADGRRHRPRPPADPDLLAGRAGAADHLAAGRHQGPERRRSEDDFNLGIYRMQVTGRNTTLMRWLKHRGGAQHHRALEGSGQARAAAGRRRDRRRSRHDPRRRDAGARHAVGIPVRRPAARQARSSWSTARPCR